MNRLLLGPICVAILAAVPSLFGYWNEPSGFQWTGILTRNTADVNGYLSIIEEVRQGHWRARNLFTAETHAPFQIRPLYGSLGIIGRAFPSVSSVALMETARIITAFLLGMMLLSLAKLLFPCAREQIYSFLLMAFGSGLGWLQLVPDPPDLRIVEFSTFLTLLSPPLYTVSLSLILGILFCLHRAWSQNNPKYGWLAGGLALWLGLDRPFALAPLCSAVIAVFLIEWRRKKTSFRSNLVVLPFFAGAALSISYQLYAISKVPVYAEWNRQHVLLTPDWLRFAIGYGLLIPLALLGVRPLIEKQRYFGLLIVSYILATVVFSHLPIQFQERFLEALSVCLSLTASCGLIAIVQRFRHSSLRTVVAVLCLVFLIPSSFISWTRDLRVIANQKPPQYMPERLLEGMRRLAELSRPEQSVFSAESTGNFIAAYAARPVVLGHRIQTANYGQKRKLVEKVLRGDEGDPATAQLLLNSGAQWLFWGPEEAWLAEGRFQPEEALFLNEEYSNGLVRLFRMQSTKIQHEE